MKIRISILTALLFVFASGFAQEVEVEENVSSKGDTTEIKLKKSKIIIINLDSTRSSKDDDGNFWDEDDDKPAYFQHWSGVSIGINMLVNDQQSIAKPAGAAYLELNHARSWNFNFNLFEKNIPIVKNYLQLSTGVGINTNTYSFRSNSSLVPGTDSVQAIPSQVSFDRNRLNTTAVRIPLLLGINTSKDPDKGLHLTAGVVGGYTMGINLEQKYFSNGEKHVTRVRNDFNVNRWNASAMVGVGIGDWAYLYSEYQLTSFFENNNDPQVAPFTVGLRLFDLD